MVAVMKNPLLPVFVILWVFLNTGCGALRHPVAAASGLARSAASSASGAAHGMVGAARTAKNLAIGGTKSASAAALRTGAKVVGKAAEVAPYAAAAAAL
ncbi:MAG: hypothetical protein DVB23_002557 [Verrucomicrobia bacterium]|jgi:hypothetical protein|nr:MAG: hypothetical protein DVB23_002557 [Verrucomicrobiota bacterium]